LKFTKIPFLQKSDKRWGDRAVLKRTTAATAELMRLLFITITHEGGDVKGHMKGATVFLKSKGCAMHPAQGGGKEDSGVSTPQSPTLEKPVKGAQTGLLPVAPLSADEFALQVTAMLR
jgi:hypothetical protein